MAECGTDTLKCGSLPASMNNVDHYRPKQSNRGFTAMDYDNLCWCAYKLPGRCRIQTNNIIMMIKALYG
jgi:hypothetical protein